jgi:hypothetical protein
MSRIASFAAHSTPTSYRRLYRYMYNAAPTASVFCLIARCLAQGQTCVSASACGMRRGAGAPHTDLPLHWVMSDYFCASAYARYAENRSQ